jgi:hypothetical protein
MPGKHGVRQHRRQQGHRGARALVMFVALAVTGSAALMAHTATAQTDPKRASAAAQVNQSSFPRPGSSKTKKPKPTKSPAATPSTSGTAEATPTSTPTATPSPTESRASDGWVTVVDDRFDVAGGPPAHWREYDGPYGSGTHNCARPSHNYVQGGSMTLLMAYETSGKCGADWYTGGLQLASEYASVDQRITVRFRVVGTNPADVRSHRIIPMHFGDEQTPSWPHGGEADYCEGSSTTGCTSFLHYFGTSRDDQIMKSHSADLTRWNVIRVERRDHRVSVFLNDLATPAWRYVGDATTVPDIPQRVVLQQECRSGGCPSASLAGEREAIEIDWITVENPS